VDGEWNMDEDDVMGMQWDSGQAFCFLLCLSRYCILVA
jgi:hypothetical protein